MDKGFLIEILQMYKDDEQSVGSVLIAIDEYIQQQVKNLTILCCAIGFFINLISNSYERIKIQSVG